MSEDESRQVPLDALPALLPRLNHVTALPPGAAAWVVAERARIALDANELPLVVVAATRDDADRIASELRFHLHDDGTGDPADDTRTWDGLSPHPELPRQRLAALRAIDEGEPVVVVVPARALLARVLSPESIDELTVSLEIGTVVEPADLVANLVDHGYFNAPLAEEPGTVALRGGVVDVWPAGSPNPVRIEFFDDEIESMASMNAHTGRAREPLDDLLLLPAREAVVTEAALKRANEHTLAVVDERGSGQVRRRKLLGDLKAGLWFPGAEDYLCALHPVVPISDRLTDLGPGRVVVVEGRDADADLDHFDRRWRERWALLSDEDKPLIWPGARFLSPDDLRAVLQNAIQVGALTVAPAGEPHSAGARDNADLAVGKGDLDPVATRLRAWLDDGWRVALAVDSHGRLERLHALLQPHGLKPIHRLPGRWFPGELSAWVGPLDRGFRSEDAQLAVITADELFGAKARPAKRTPKKLKDAALSAGGLAQLKVGDFVVHVRHGVGTFQGLVRKTITIPDGMHTRTIEQDYVEVEYRRGDRLALPVTRLDEVYKYRAIGNKQPKLDKLGGATWATKRSKARDRIANLAHQLLRLHAHRATADGFTYSGLPAEYIQFEQTFPFVETPDQDQAIQDVLTDLERDAPMDRLIIGDVGFGKTEVAMRATMRVVLDGRQVAVLCPTTVLAYQHHRTFQERFADSGVEVRLLSSFVSTKDKKTLKEDLLDGKVDVVIGTHALLSRSVRFRELGLVVVDEEHRFGVKQKEKLKALASTWSTRPCDYLAMSATPIPRSLHMALGGLRDVSVIATPPPGRRPVLTRIMKWDDRRIREEILHELQRGGQVFVVHDRVQTIQPLAARIEALVPEATVGVGHGQMETGALEKVLVRFVRGELRVLVCTTIIESGIDMPGVNTILVHRAHMMGLAQLYQLRGRVGRGHVRGYCTLIVPEEQDHLTKKAVHRLQVLQDNQELGAGMQVATADMELRGSGDLLGDSQHGQIDAVGLDTYIELLDEAVAHARGELTRERLDPEIELPVKSIIPDDFIDEVPARLAAYRELGACRTVDEVRRLVDRWESEWGEPPPEVLNLGWSAEARIRARALGIERVTWMRVRVVLDFHPTTTVNPARIADLVTRQPRRFAFGQARAAASTDGKPGYRLEVRFSPEEGEAPYRFLHWVFRQLERE
jgi:transcription-repair coupling factor (superfamily II helicase)